MVSRKKEPASQGYAFLFLQNVSKEIFKIFKLFESNSAEQPAELTQK